MKQLGLLGLMWCALIQSMASDYELFNENGKVGLKDQAGLVLIPAAFDALGWSDQSFSMIGDVTGYKVGSRWGLINLKKEHITEPIYEGLIRSDGDRMVAFKKTDPVTTKAGCIDLHGRITVPFKYDGIKISGLRATAFIKEGKRFRFGVIDLNDNILIPFQFQNIYPIGSLRYAVENFDNKTALYSESGTRLTEFSIDSISNFKKGFAIIYHGFSQGLIDREGRIRVQPQFNEIAIGNDGTIRSRKPNRWMLVSANHQITRSLDCDEIIPDKPFHKIQSAGKFGLVDDSLNTIIAPAYDYVGEFVAHLAVVRVQQHYGVVRPDNTMLLPAQYDSVILDHNFMLLKEHLLGSPSWSLYDTFAVKKTEKTYEDIRPFNGKYFQVTNYGYVGALNRYGKEFIHCVFDSIIAHNNDQLIVKFHGQYGIINFEQEWLLPPQDLPLGLVDDEHYAAWEGQQFQFRNFDGNLIYFTDNRIEIKPDHLLEFLPDGSEKQIDFQGLMISRTAPPGEEDTEIVSSEHEGYRAIRRDEKYGFIDNQGRLRIANRYEGVQDFHDGFAAIKILGKWGFINRTEKIVINPGYEEVQPFHHGISIVKRGAFGLINTEGATVLERRYEHIERLTTGRYQIMNNGLLGLVGETGELLIEPRFSHLDDLGNGHVIIERDGKWGLLTLQGMSTIPMMYDHLIYLPEQDKYLAMIASPWEKVEL